MYSPELAQKLISKFPDAAIVPLPEKFVRDPAATVKVPAAKLREICKFIKTDIEFQMDLPNHMTAVDYIKEGKFELVYYFYSTKKKLGLVLKSEIPRATPVIDSVTDLWSGFDFQEREVFDLMGITFTGHPYLKRIMMWDGFPGHPLRKDYVHITDKYDSGLEVGTPGLDEKGVGESEDPMSTEAPILTSTVPQGPVFETKIEKVGENEMLLNLGPQHPSTHGVLRVVLKLDGEVITDAVADMGYLHRGVEKLAEHRTYPMIIVLSDRDDYLSAMNNNWAFCLAVEKLLQVQIPERADLIRIIVGELNRMASHMVFYGTFGIDIGAFTPFLHAFGRDREEILDLYEEICGARITYNFVRVGGIMLDAPEGWIGRVKEFCERMKPRLIEYDKLLTYNPIFMDRTIGIGKITAARAINLGVTGPILRGSGVPLDLRKDQPYGLYKEFNFDVPTGKTGDCYDRFMVRRRELDESLKIITQACDRIKEGPVMGKVAKIYRPPAGEVYDQLEGPRGWLGSYIVSDGTERPYRYHIRPPSFINLQTLSELVRGLKIADVIAVLGSIDFVLGEVDR